jgi:hypothetical protein
MEELTIAIISGFFGVMGGLIVMYVKEIFLHNKHLEEEQKRYILKQRIEKLYSPLYTRIKSAEIVFGERKLLHSKDEMDEFRKLIENYSHLASNELQPLLLELLFKPAIGKKIEKLVELVVKEYEELKDQYFKF